jgi:hypothetical protein
MARSNFVQNKFVSGELSENIKSRTDLDQYYQGMEIASNVVTTPQGGVKRRMGSEFVDVPQGKTVRMTNASFSSTRVRVGSDITDLNDNDTSTVVELSGPQNSANVVMWENEFPVSPTFTKTVSFIDLVGIKFVEPDASDPAPESTEFLLESSTTGANGTWGADGTNEQSIVVPKITNFEQDIRLRVDIPVSTTGGADTFVRRYWRLVRRASTDMGNAYMSIQDVNFFELDTGVLTEDYKLHKFEVSKEDSFLLFFTPTNLRIYRVTDTATTYLQDINHGLGVNYPNRVATNENVMLLFNKNVAPRRLVYNYNNDGFFYYDTPTFDNIPRYDFDDRFSPTEVTAVNTVTFHANFVAGDKYQLEIDGVLSKEIVYHGDANTDEQTATARSMQVNLQDMPVFGDSGITVTRTNTDQYTVQMSGDSANDYPLMTGFGTTNSHPITFNGYTQGRDTKEPIWSATRGYPNLGVFAQGRLWLGGTRDRPQVLMASQAGVYLDFKVDRGEASEGFLFTINGSKSAIVDVTGGRGVTVFTEGAEYSITGNTPATLDAQQQTQHGSFSEDVPTLALDGTTLFVDRNGRTLRQFIFDYREEGFRSVDMSVLSSHLINKPLDMDAVTAVSADDANYVFIINEDGTAVVMNTLRDQDITGFTKFDQVRPAVDASEIQGSSVSFAGSTDKFMQVVAVNNVLHVLSETGASTAHAYQYTLSRLTLNHLMDASVKFEPQDLGGGYYHPQYLTGTKHLAGNQIIHLVAGNSVLPPRYAAQYANVVELTDAERQLNVTIEVGRNFVPTVKPMPLSTMMASGDNIQMALKRVDRMNLRVINSAGVNIDGVAVPVREFGDSGSSPLNTSLVPTTGIIEDNNGGNGWGREVVPKITVPDPTPFHLLAIDYEISS